MFSTALLTLALLAGPEPLRLSPGSQEVLKIPGLTRVALTGTDIIDVKAMSNGELLVIGKQKGRTNLTWWVGNKVVNRAVVVDDGRSTELARLIHDAISPSIKVEQYGSRVVIDGVVDSVEDMARLKQLVADDANVTVMVQLNPRVMPVVAEMITVALQREGLKTARAVCIGSKIFLEGSVSDQAESAKAQLIADAIVSRAQGGR